VVNSKEALLWSIAFPGFGQFLYGKPIKGIVFVFLEFQINVQSNFNTIIISSFQGDIKKRLNTLIING
jgi:TM2 domain-containing membrane protein YozV